MPCTGVQAQPYALAELAHGRQPGGHPPGWIVDRARRVVRPSCYWRIHRHVIDPTMRPRGIGKTVRRTFRKQDSSAEQPIWVYSAHALSRVRAGDDGLASRERLHLGTT